jgi:hypothetical protein
VVALAHTDKRRFWTGALYRVGAHPRAISLTYWHSQRSIGSLARPIRSAIGTPWHSSTSRTLTQYWNR